MIKYEVSDDITRLIKHIMIDNNIRQKDIVSNTGLSKQTISNLLNNRSENMSFNTVKMLCDALQCDLYVDIKRRADGSGRTDGKTDIRRTAAPKM